MPAAQRVAAALTVGLRAAGLEGALAELEAARGGGFEALTLALDVGARLLDGVVEGPGAAELDALAAELEREGASLFLARELSRRASAAVA